MDLSHAIPRAEFDRRFVDVRETIRASSVKALAQEHPNGFLNLCLFIWDEMLHRGAACNPGKLSAMLRDPYKDVYNIVHGEFGRAPINELFAADYGNEHSDTTPFARIALADCYPEDVHIVNVEFRDLTRPLALNEPARESRAYKGLGMFDPFLLALKKVAKERGARRISLVVSWPPLHSVFARHGFTVSETRMARFALRTAGYGFPMVLPL